MTAPSKNNEPATPPAVAVAPRMKDRRRDGVWRGPRLYFRGRLIATIVQDVRYADMWRVRLPDGTISDMVNLSRAKDAAMWLTGGAE